MLALSRKKNEALVINNNIEVTVLDIKGDQVKIGISAPKEVPVYRKEIYLQIQEANKAAMEPEMAEALKNIFQFFKRPCLQRKGRGVICFLVNHPDSASCL